jgi:hypothetical protein
VCHNINSNSRSADSAGGGCGLLVKRIGKLTAGKPSGYAFGNAIQHETMGWIFDELRVGRNLASASKLLRTVTSGPGRTRRQRSGVTARVRAGLLLKVPMRRGSALLVPAHLLNNISHAP